MGVVDWMKDKLTPETVVHLDETVQSANVLLNGEVKQTLRSVRNLVDHQAAETLTAVQQVVETDAKPAAKNIRQITEELNRVNLPVQAMKILKMVQLALWSIIILCGMGILCLLKYLAS